MSMNLFLLLYKVLFMFYFLFSFFVAYCNTNEADGFMHFWIDVFTFLKKLDKKFLSHESIGNIA